MNLFASPAKVVHSNINIFKLIRNSLQLYISSDLRHNGYFVIGLLIHFHDSNLQVTDMQ